MSTIVFIIYYNVIIKTVKTCMEGAKVLFFIMVGVKSRKLELMGVSEKKCQICEKKKTQTQTRMSEKKLPYL